ncbi:dipeptidase [Novosphingobium sp. Gsoil 351]|uniref:dipeptidase n=1 Tax=Novosphingobium sp. Gsoil 351 TaxID=2675225 RepID=UPI0012B46CD2|nr:dipeptidase [Novosphingobium sp. Gsoil 351]QGN53763.1 membrane dipeptidase [Novosphingobium sp. Gsoil 351]
MNRIAIPLLALILASPAFAAPARSPEQAAAAALKAAPVWDGHNDVPEQLRDRTGDLLDGFDFTDTRNTAQGGKVAMQTDLSRLKRGHVGAQFWSVYVDYKLAEPEAVRQTIEQIDTIKRLVARYPGELALATSSADVEKAWKAGRIASLIGMEGGGSIGGSLAVLRQMHALGARYMTLAHYKTTAWADSSNDVSRNGGLSDFGKQVVREMQRVGMLVDLSHCSEETMNDALDVAGAPVVFTHSNARAVDGHPRNVPDAVLDRLKNNGGIVMVTAVLNFVSEDYRIWAAELAGEEARLKSLHTGLPDRVAPALAAWTGAHPAPRVTVSQIADHIDHIVKRIGIDHVGVGGDFDGTDETPKGFEDVSAYPNLFAELARRGYSQGDLERISSRNMLRVLRAAEAYAAKHRNDPPIETRAVTAGG